MKTARNGGSRKTAKPRGLATKLWYKFNKRCFCEARLVTMATCRRTYVWLKYVILQGDPCSTALWRYIVLLLLLINIYVVYHHVDNTQGGAPVPATQEHSVNKGEENQDLVPKNPEAPQRPEELKPDYSKFKCKPFKLNNPSFESDGFWMPYEPKGKGSGGFSIVSNVASHGKKSIKVTNGGAFQIIKFPAGTKKFVFAADSRNRGITKAMSSDYSVWCDIKDKKGKRRFGLNAKFLLKSGGALHDWHERKLTVANHEDLVEARCYCMFRNYPSGEAWFDNVRLWIVPSTVDFDDCAYSHLT